ncbi:Sugar kinase of the NBD/HSP70 family, may contain an N-terminal HTH domain [Rubritalea squalenifaciens DSM 18772]|uniref:Sugar kinase of the NBD/HSP70 family, may contain an N-terminal HTH domain n=1 Tax=Rubritalea squalenifaciens DSM 18772 TaxID=1123071 RepID=A0A1M6L972_9BACT|nr:ROK family protein [Rubritalea squalenifaciens]SHJ67715.1 Sugar kinase of the NBD/HSP70 family, may contain an N-terminal HTH domain [Rubritalea squalenifaciens DSM 18772]
MNIEPKVTPVLDEGFVPAVLWNAAYREQVAADAGATELKIAVGRLDGTVFRKDVQILSHEGENVALNLKYVERLVKFMLWAQGGCTVYIAGNDDLAKALGDIYSETGARKFDWDIVGKGMFGQFIEVKAVSLDEIPEQNSPAAPLGRNLDGNRIGFDLGGSDRKCAAVVNGEVVFSTEIPWDPYFQEDPSYQREGIIDSLKKAAEHLPSVDAIGGSSAGVYINNEVRIASLFRGIKDKKVFEEVVVPMFKDIAGAEYPGVPFEVINDGEVTALAGSITMDTNSVLGVAMGTSEAVGYVDPQGNVTTQINELAFAPVDYRDGGPVDEWSGDEGCGVQFFCQQGVARLAPKAGFDFGDMPFPEQLVEVQKAMAEGDERARKIYETIGTCFGYAIAHYAEFYHIGTLIIMGRVTSGEGGQVMIDGAKKVLELEFPELAEQINITQPDEKMKRHGQAVAAASLPSIPKA